MTTAVEIRCPKGHLIGAVRPFPARGAATHIDLEVAAARYRPGMAAYLRDSDADGWLTVPASHQRLTVEEFSHPGWARSATWACRCGLSKLGENEVIEAAWAWSAERGRAHGNPPRPRVLIAQRITNAVG